MIEPYNYVRNDVIRQLSIKQWQYASEETQCMEEAVERCYTQAHTQQPEISQRINETNEFKSKILYTRKLYALAHSAQIENRLIFTHTHERKRREKERESSEFIRM